MKAAPEIYTGRPFVDDATPSVGELSHGTSELWDRHTVKRGEGPPPHLYESDSAFNATVSSGSATRYPLGANAMHSVVDVPGSRTELRSTCTGGAYRNISAPRTHYGRSRQR